MTPLPFPDANHCGICGRQYEFVTTGPFGIGLIKPVHPVGRCVPFVGKPYELEDEDAPPEELPDDLANCAGCRKPFTKKRCSQLYCLPSCRVLHVERKKPRTFCCSICDVKFKSTRPVRETCGAEPCIREYRRRHIKLWTLSREVREFRRRQGSRRAAA